MAGTGLSAITETRAEIHGTNVGMLLQQNGSKLRNCVTAKSFTGNAAEVVTQFGTAGSQEVTERFGDTPVNAINTDRRWVYPIPIDSNLYVDKFELNKSILDPKGPYAMAQAKALGRDMDDIILSGILGDNNTGERGATTTSFAAGNVIAAGGTGLTIDKLRTLRENMLNNDVPLDEGFEDIIFLMPPEAGTDLLETTEVTSSDYSAVKALANGRVDTFMGFSFKTSNRLAGAAKNSARTLAAHTPAANVIRCLAFPKSAVCLGLWDDIMVRADERPDKRYLTQLYTKMMIGATRVEENQVYAIDIDTSV